MIILNLHILTWVDFKNLKIGWKMQSAEDIHDGNLKTQTYMLLMGKDV